MNSNMKAGFLLLFIGAAFALSVHDANIQDCGAIEASSNLNSRQREHRLEKLENETSTIEFSSTSNSTADQPESSPKQEVRPFDISNYRRTMWSDWLEFEERPLSNFYYFKEGLSVEQVDYLLGQVHDLPSKEGTVFNSADNTSVVNTYRKSRIRWIPKAEPYMWLYQELARLTKIANNRMWKFDVSGMYEDIQFTEYHGDEKGFYDWHLDINESTAMRKISIVVMLSDPSEYEGGRLQFKTGQAERDAPNEKGAVVIFPPYFLHRVSPVTKGIRRTLVLWVSGPPLR